MKKILLGLIIVLILVVGAFCLSLNMLVRTQGAELASKAIGVDVSIGNVDISLMNQTVLFEDFEIGSPEGFEAPYTMNFKRIYVDATDLFNNPIMIDRAEIGSYDVYFETNETGNNMMALKNNLQRSDTKRDTQEKGEGRDVVIKTLSVDSGKVHSSASLLGQSTGDQTLTIPGFTRDNLGTQQNPISGAEVFEIIFSRILNSAMSLNPAQLITKENVKGFMEGASEKVGGAIKGLLGE